MNAKTLTQSLIAGVFAVSAGLGFAADAAKPEAKPARCAGPGPPAASRPAAKADAKPEVKSREVKRRKRREEDVKKAEHKTEHKAERKCGKD